MSRNDSWTYIIHFLTLEFTRNFKCFYSYVTSVLNHLVKYIIFRCICWDFHSQLSCFRHSSVSSSQQITEHGEDATSQNVRLDQANWFNPTCATQFALKTYDLNHLKTYNFLKEINTNNYTICKKIHVATFSNYIYSWLTFLKHDFVVSWLMLSRWVFTHTWCTQIIKPLEILIE